MSFNKLDLFISCSKNPITVVTLTLNKRIIFHPVTLIHTYLSWTCPGWATIILQPIGSFPPMCLLILFLIRFLSKRLDATGPWRISFRDQNLQEGDCDCWVSIMRTVKDKTTKVQKNIEKTKYETSPEMLNNGEDGMECWWIIMVLNYSGGWCTIPERQQHQKEWSPKTGKTIAGRATREDAGVLQAVTWKGGQEPGHLPHGWQAKQLDASEENLVSILC